MQWQCFSLRFCSEHLVWSHSVHLFWSYQQPPISCKSSHKKIQKMYARCKNFLFVDNGHFQVEWRAYKQESAVKDTVCSSCNSTVCSLFEASPPITMLPREGVPWERETCLSSTRSSSEILKYFLRHGLWYACSDFHNNFHVKIIWMGISVQ